MAQRKKYSSPAERIRAWRARQAEKAGRTFNPRRDKFWGGYKDTDARVEKITCPNCGNLIIPPESMIREKNWAGSIYYSVPFEEEHEIITHRHTEAEKNQHRMDYELKERAFQEYKDWKNYAIQPKEFSKRKLNEWFTEEELYYATAQEIYEPLPEEWEEKITETKWEKVKCPSCDESIEGESFFAQLDEGSGNLIKGSNRVRQARWYAKHRKGEDEDNGDD